MAKPEWGLKRICPSCATRYYDMQKNPPVCPSCSTQFDPEALLRSRRSRPVPVDDTPPKKAARSDDDENALDMDDGPEVEESLEGDAGSDDIEEEEVVDEDDALLEDASELGGDMDEVIDGVEEGSDDEH